MTAAASTSLLQSPSSEIDWEQMSFSKTLNKSLLTVKQADGVSYRIYRLIRAYRETQHFRCSTCDRLNAKKNTRYMPKVRTKSGKLVGDPFPQHHPECQPLSVEEYGLRQIDRLCRWHIKEKHVPPKAAWELGRKYCRHFAERHNLNPEEFILCFPEFERIKGTYLRIYQQGGGLPSNTTDDLSTMIVELPPAAGESLEFLYAADREHYEPVQIESLEDLNESAMSAHDIRRKIDQLTMVTELPRDPITDQIIFTVPYEELCSRVVCVEGDDEVKLFFSKRCRPQVTFRGHVYYLYTEKTTNSESENKRWRCIEPRCHGFLTTNDDCSKIVDNNVSHIGGCVPDVNKLEMKVAMYDLRLMAEFTTCSPQQLLSDFYDKLARESPHLIELLPTNDNMARMLEQHRDQFLIRTRFEFESLNRIARHEHEENVKNAFLFSKNRRTTKFFPKTLCLWCGAQIGEDGDTSDRKKANQDRRYAQEALIQHLIAEHGKEFPMETVAFPKMSHFKGYLKELSAKKSKFIRKGHFAGGTYYLCHCDGRVNRTSGLHCPAFIRVVNVDDATVKDNEEVTVEICMVHMFHDDVEGPEEPLNPEEFVRSVVEAENEEIDVVDAQNNDENAVGEECTEPVSKRPRRSTAGQPKSFPEEPEKSASTRIRRPRAAKKVAQVNYAIVEQMDDFEAHIESLRDRVKSLKSADEIARINAKLQELEDAISEDYTPHNHQFVNEEPGPSAPPTLMPMPMALPPRTTVTVIRPVIQRIQPPEIQQADIANHADLTPIDVGSPYKVAMRKADGTVVFYTKNPLAAKRLVRVTPIHTAHSDPRVVRVTHMSASDQNQTIDVD